MAERVVALLLALSGVLTLCQAAKAETRLCNRTSVVTEAAIGVEAQGTAATRGWFRIDPGQCRVILQTADAPGRLFVHARALEERSDLPVPGIAPTRLCVGEGDFLIPGAQTCTRPDTRLAPFAEMRPTTVEGVSILFLSEESDYDLPGARRAGIQRLLTMLGYDPGPVDGVDGPRTEAALRGFIADSNLPADTGQAPDLFDTLLAALRGGEGPGFSWCNETAHVVLAALGTEEPGRVTTRGWYRIEPGRCLKPRTEPGQTRFLSFAEAVDAQGRTVTRAGRPLAFAGDVPACIRRAEFEIAGVDCAAQGANPVLFQRVSLDGRRRAAIRFREP